MSDRLLVTGTVLSSTLRQAVAGRRREFRVVTDLAATTGPLRGALVGPGAPTDTVDRVLGERDLAVLALGHRSAGCPEAGAGVAAVTVRRTEAATEDPVTGPMADHVRLLWDGGDLTAAVREGFEPLLTDEAGGAVVVARRDRIYLSSLRPELDAAGVIDDPTIARFTAAQGTALVLRWIDLVVGRTPEEMPWGRRGPRPVAAPGLVLHSA